MEKEIKAQDISEHNGKEWVDQYEIIYPSGQKEIFKGGYCELVSFMRNSRYTENRRVGNPYTNRTTYYFAKEDQRNYDYYSI